ncbi:MAG: VOC family protein [Gallionellaceae bacterium]
MESAIRHSGVINLKITPFLWFDNQAEEAMNCYVSVFKNPKVASVQRYGDKAAKASGRPKGSVMTASFILDGQAFVALNSGPIYKITPAVSFVVNCKTQDEIDELWGKFTAGGEEVQCGWLTNKFGVSWQIVPSALSQLFNDPDPVRAGGVMHALLQMKKLDIAGLQHALDQAD